MSVDIGIPTHLNIRINAKLRYLTELAARARNMSLTEYIEAALEDSFGRVSVDQYPELSEEPDVFELSEAQRREKFRKRQVEVRNPLSEVAEGLWSEHPMIRLQLLAVSGLNWLMSDEENHIWNHVFDRTRYKTKDGKLDLKAIEKDWTKIKFAAAHDAKQAREKGDR